MSIVYWQHGDRSLRDYDSFVSPIVIHENFKSDLFDSCCNFGTKIPYEAFKELLKGKSLSFFVNDEYCFSICIEPDDLKKCLSEVVE